MRQRRPIAEGFAAAVFGLWLALAAPARAGAAAPADAQGVGLIGVRLGGDATTTRVVLDLDAAVTAKVVAADSGADRLVLSLPPLLTTGPLGGAGGGLVKGWSIAGDAHGARLVLVLAQGAAPTRRFLIPPDAPGGRWRYVIDLADSDPLAVLAAGGAPPASPASPAPVVTRASVPRPIGAVPAVMATPPALVARAAPPPSAPSMSQFAAQVPARPQPGLDPEATAGAPPQRLLVSRPAPARAAARGGMKIIVVDAGHGGHDTGARSLVRNEKDINLAAALDLRDRLEAMGRYKVVMTRSSDVFIPLEERVRIARRAGADLFISLHSDSAGTDPTPHGASVYTVSDHGETRVNNVLGPNEWFSRVADKDAGVRQLLLDLTQRSTRNRSAQFAHILIDHINDKVDLLPRSHRDAGYFVLLAPDVPAVLLEMGFITNPSDELRLTDPAQRGRLMDGVAEAIDTYFSGETRMAAGF